MSIEEVVGRLKAHEERLRGYGEKDREQGLLLTHAEWVSRSKQHNGKESTSSSKGRGGGHAGRGRGRGRGQGRGRGRDSNQPRNESNKPKKDKSKVKCYSCDEFGHYASECPKKNHGEEANLTQANEEEPILMMAISQEVTSGKVSLKEKICVNLLTSGESRVNSEVWYLDNGASNHMTGDRLKFHELDENITGHVRFGDGSTVAILGKGSILFDCKNGDQRLLNEVYFIPSLKNNIISLGQMTEEGSQVIMDGSILSLFDRNKTLLLRVKRSSNRLYKTLLKTGRPICLLATKDEPAWTWHSRLGHVNFPVLKKMSEKNMATGVPKIEHPNQVCEGCVIAKQTRTSFPNQAVFRAQKPLQLVHADLCGPITPTSIGGSKYFLLLIDDFSRWMWVYTLSEKLEAFSVFKRFKLMVEKSSGYKIKALRTDRGGEFTSKDFTSFFEENGVKRHLTTPYSPQQNGVVER